MNWEYSLKIIRDSNDNIAKIVPIKELKSESGEILASVDISPKEYADSIVDSKVADFFEHSVNLFHTEISSMFAYDPTLDTFNKGISGSNSAYAVGAAMSVILDIGMALVSRLNGVN